MADGMSLRVRRWAKGMRKNPTKAESALFAAAKALGSQVLSQVPFGNKKKGQRIVDIYLPRLKIALEADGSQHYAPEGLKADAERAAFFGKHYPAVKFLRYPNHEIMRHGFIDRLRGDINAIVGAVVPFAVVASMPPLTLDGPRPAAASFPPANAPAVGS